MRISTTPLILICSVLFFGVAFETLAQPVFTIENRHHVCGPVGTATGSFDIVVTSAGGSADLKFFVSPGAGAEVSVPMPTVFPYTFPISGLTGNLAGPRTYVVVVTDADVNSQTTQIYNFEVTQGTVTDNTSSNCSVGNGAITMTLRGNSAPAALPIVYSWTGPNGFTAITKDISGLQGGDYTLTYHDSNTPAQTQCTVGPIHINDPNPPDYNSLLNGAACGGDALGLDLSTLKKVTSVAASSFELVSTVFTGLTPGPGLPAADGSTITATDLADDVWTNTDVVSHDVTYTIKTYRCAQAGNTITVKYTIAPQPVYNNIDNTTPGLCSRTALGVTLDGAKVNLVADSYTVTAVVSTGLTAISGVAGAAPYAATNTSLSDDVWQNINTTFRDVTYTIVPKIGSCSGSPFTVTVRIHPQPSAPDANPVICSKDAVNFDIQNHYATNGNNLAATTFEWQAADNTSVTGETTALQTVATTIADVLENTSTSNQVVIYTVTPKTGACTGTPFKINVTVNAEPKAPDAPKTICSKDNVAFNLQDHLDNNGNAIASSTFSWFADDNANVSGETLSGGAGNTINDPLINVSSTSQQVVYHVTPKSPANCVGADFKVTVTVNPQPVSPTIPKTICSGDNVNVNLQTQGIDLGNAIANTTFSWSAADNSFVTGESLSTQTSQSIADPLVNTSAIAQDVIYTVTPKSPAPALCVGDPFTVKITVSPKPVYNNYTDATGVCASPIGVDLDARKGATSVLASAYDVLVLDHTDLTPAGGSPALTLISDAPTGEIADDVWSNVTATSKNVVYQVTPKAGTCVGANFTVTVAIKPQPGYVNAPVIICSGLALNFNLDDAKIATSVTADLYDITDIIIPLNVSPTAGNPQVKNGVTKTELLDDVWSNIIGGAAPQVIYKVVPHAGTCVGAEFQIAVTVHPEPVYADKTLPAICSEAPVNFDLEGQKFAGGVSATQFIINAVATGLTSANATTKLTDTGNNMVISDDQWTNVSDIARPVVYTITPKTADGCLGADFKITVIISQQPDYNNYNNVNVPGGICSVPLAVDIKTLQKPNTIEADVFTFTMPAPAGLTLVTDGGTPNDISDDVWANATSSNHDVTYHIIPSAGGCDGEPFDVTVTILPTPGYNDYINDNAPGGICSKGAIGVDITLLKKALSAPAGSFAITVDSKGLPQFAGAATTSNIADDAWENKTTAPVDVEYTIIPKTGTCEGAPFTVTVTINPQPVSTDLPKTICTGNNVNFDLQLDGLNVGGNSIASTFQWQAADNPDVTGETTTLSSLSSINDPLVNNTTTDQIVVYTVTPKSTKGCLGDPFKVNITVAVKPVLGANAPADICSGSAVNYAFELTPAGQPVGTTFSWSAIMDYTNITGESTSGQAGLTITDVLVNTGTTAQTVVYSVAPVLGTCVGIAKDVSITVYPGLIVNAGGDQTICNDVTGYFIAGASKSTNVTSFQWFIESGPAGATIDPPTDVNDPSTAQFHASIEGNYVLRIESNPDPLSICTPGVDWVTITVTKKPVITPGPQLKTICGNDLVAYEILMDQRDFNQAAVFTWPNPNDPTGVANAKPSPPGGIPMGPVGTIHINDELRNETNGNIDVTYTVTASVGICVGTTELVKITVKPSPVVAFGQTKTICSGETVDHEILLDPVNTPAGTKFSWPDPDGSGSATSRKDVVADPVGTKHILDTLYHFDPAGLPTTVTYQIISQGVNGCYGRTRDINIIVNSGAIANAGAPQQICSDAVLTLGTTSVSGSTTFGWTIIQQPASDGVVTDGATVDASTFKGTTPGVYKLQLTTGAPTAGACAAVSDVVVITVKPIGDPSCTGTGGPGPCTLAATVTVTDATCNNNDGTIKVEVTAGTGPFTYVLNGTVVNLPADNTIKGLTANTYTLDVIDAVCTKTYPTNISFPGYINYTAPVAIAPDCISGTNGKVVFTISDPGSFEFAITADLIVQPTTYNSLGGNIVSINNLARGEYAVWLRPIGAGVKCPTKVPVTIDGVYAVSYTAAASNVICFSDASAISVSDIKGAPDLLFSYALTNTNDNSVRTGSISASQALSTYSITGVTKGDYSLLITQDQSSLGLCVSPIHGSAVTLDVDAPVAALDTLYVRETLSVPDLPSGAALVGVAPSGREPYEVRLELVQPVFASQQYVMDWTEVPLNPQNLKFEYNFKNLYAGDYVLNLRDSLGCEKTYPFSLDVDTQLFIPNIFTPNEDGFNDVFYIRNLPSDAKLLITNRWGNEVFKTSAYQNDWGGGDSVDGLYYYTLNVGKDKYTGWVEILRAQ